jgi:hypothetical protein
MASNFESDDDYESDQYYYDNDYDNDYDEYYNEEEEKILLTKLKKQLQECKNYDLIREKEEKEFNELINSFSYSKLTWLFMDGYNKNSERIKNINIDNLNEKSKEEIILIIKMFFYDNFKELINEYKKSALIIQKAFKKYRYTPKYKFCKYTQINNLYKLGGIEEEDFKQYLNDENIKTY